MLGLSGEEVLPDSLVKPVLSYPISASSSAENTFTAFAKLEGLYQKYAALFSLPVITQPLVIVDSLVPESARPGAFKVAAGSKAYPDGSGSEKNVELKAAVIENHTIKPLAFSGEAPTERHSPTTGKSQKVDVALRRTRSEEFLRKPESRISSVSSSLDFGYKGEHFAGHPALLKVSPPVIIQGLLDSSVDVATSPMSQIAASEFHFSSTQTMYGASARPSESLQSETDNIVNKIIATIDKHVDSGVDSRELKYKNGVTCEISIIESIGVAGVAKLDAIRSTIKDAVETAIGGGEDLIRFSYKGCRFQLIAKPTLTQEVQAVSTNHRIKS